MPEPITSLLANAAAAPPRRPSPNCKHCASTSSHGRYVSDLCPLRADWLLTVRGSDGTLVDVSGARPWICPDLARPLVGGDGVPIPIPAVGTPYTWRLAGVPTRLVVACAHWIPASAGCGEVMLCVRVADASACDSIARSDEILMRISAAGIIDLALVANSAYPSVIPALFGKHVLALVGAFSADSAALLRALALAARSGCAEQSVIHASVAGNVDLGRVRVSVRAVGGGRMALSVVPAALGGLQQNGGVWEHDMRNAGMVVSSQDMFPECEDEWVVGARDSEYVPVEVEDLNPQRQHPIGLLSQALSWVHMLSLVHGQLGQALDLATDACVAIRAYIAEYAAYLVQCANDLVCEARVAVKSVADGSWVGGLLLAAAVG